MTVKSNFNVNHATVRSAPQKMLGIYKPQHLLETMAKGMNIMGKEMKFLGIEIKTMVKKMKTQSHRMIFLCLFSLILLGTLGGMSALSSQTSSQLTSQNQSAISTNDISTNDVSTESTYGISSEVIQSSSQLIDWGSLIPLSPQIFTSGDDLQNFTSPESGDGSSWESPLILENYILEQNSTVAGLNFHNFSQYLVIKNCVFRDLYPGYREDSYSILLNNSQNIKIELNYFYAFSGSYSNAIRLEHSSNINITNNHIMTYYYGIVAFNSRDFSISNNQMWNQKYEHLRFRHVHNISIDNNEIISQSIPYQEVEGINGWNVSQCLISNNQFKEDVDALDFYSSQNITFIDNVLPYLSFYIVAEINITQNEINGGISLRFCINTTISSNTIEDATNAIGSTNSHNILIEKNTFRYISGYMFDIYYYEDEPHDYEPIWFDIPANSRQLITQNTFFMHGRGIMKENSPMVQIRFNFVFFHTGHYIFMAFSMICGGYFLYTLFIQRKKIKQLVILQKTLQNSESLDGLDGLDGLEGLKGLDLMQKHEQNLTHLVSFQILFVIGLFFSITYFESFYTGNFLRTILELMLPGNYYSDLPLRSFLVSCELLILSIFLGRILLQKLRKIRVIPPILQDTDTNTTTNTNSNSTTNTNSNSTTNTNSNSTTNTNSNSTTNATVDTTFSLNKSEKILLGSCLGIELLLEFLILRLVYFGAYEAMLLVLGAMFTLGFIVNLVGKINNRAQKVWIVIGLLGTVLISAYLIVRRSMNPNIVWSSNPDEVEWTQKILFWSFFILGGIGWAGTYLRDEELSFQQGDH
ncbi:MAG: right-handed parallel beta-helix repeat-containing protein [Promethearchaeota archaeon]